MHLRDRYFGRGRQRPADSARKWARVRASDNSKGPDGYMLIVRNLESRLENFIHNHSTQIIGINITSNFQCT